MVNTQSESLLTLAEVGKLLRKHVATVYRWSTVGYCGVVLETIQVGGTRCTSHEAVQRFCERLTDVSRPNGSRATAASMDVHKAADELERHGI